MVQIPLVGLCAKGIPPVQVSLLKARPKVRIIEQLVKDLNTNEITLLPHPDLDYQFGIFECVPLQKGKYTYAADTRVSDSHDDIVLAVAFADEARHSTRNSYSISVL